jgi:predicted 3-demethylubiquinone-9 3-methyltransferase (glyoxalase superfamily)
MPHITPFLWFNQEAEAAAKFYTSIFKKSKIGQISRYGDAGPGPKGSVMTITFTLLGQHFIALNGGPHFKFNESISFVVSCRTQKELDYYWKRLTSGGGKPVQCGWLTDKFGLSWQIVPDDMDKLMTSKDPAASHRVMKAMLKMKKLDIKGLKKAYAGK